MDRVAIIRALQENPDSRKRLGIPVGFDPSDWEAQELFQTVLDALADTSRHPDEAMLPWSEFKTAREMRDLLPQEA